MNVLPHIKPYFRDCNIYYYIQKFYQLNDKNIERVWKKYQQNTIIFFLKIHFNLFGKHEK